MRRRTATPPALGGEPVMPADLTYWRPQEDTRTQSEHAADVRTWQRAHGFDPGDWNALRPLMRASRRAHARTVAELSIPDRLRRRAEGADPDDPA